MPSTYTPIATSTYGSDAGAFSFTSIPSTYTDLIAVLNIRSKKAASTGFLCSRMNSDSGSTHSYTILTGSGSSASSSRNTNVSWDSFAEIAGNNAASGVYSTVIYHIMNYANTTTNKTLIARVNEAGSNVSAQVGLWRSTSAMTSLQFFDYDGANFAAGSSFTLYGVKSA